jgi:hypothetical protein
MLYWILGVLDMVRNKRNMYRVIYCVVHSVSVPLAWKA